MKKTTLAVVLASLIMASSSEGALLALRWAEAGFGVQQMMVGNTKTIEVVWTFTPDLGTGNNDLSSVQFSFESAPLTMSNINSVPTKWNAAGVPGPLSGTHEFNVAAASAEDNLVGPGEYVVGTFDVTLDDGDVEDVFDLTIDYYTTAVMDGSSGQYNHDGRRAASYSGYYMYGKGSPSIPSDKGCRGEKCGHWGQDADPLQLVVIPEPSTLGLFAIAVCAILRRR